MIQLTNSRLLVILSLIMSIGVLASCNKKDLPNDGKVALYSFGPTGAKHGDTLRFIGINLDKVTAIQFTGENAVVEKKDFTLQNSELIKLIVPEAAEQGVVTLKTPNGDIISKSQLNLNVLASVATVTAQARPGDNITITGNYLNWIDRITFSLNKATTTFVSQSLTELVVKVPEDAQTGTLILHYAGTDSADIETLDTLHVTLPKSTSFDPNPVKHGTDLTITGTDLDLVKKVIFAGSPAPVTNFVSQSATQLVVKVDSFVTKGKVKLEAASGVQTTSDSDLDVALPSITQMSPNPVDPESDLTITGNNLDLVTSVSFTGVADAVTTFVSQSATQLIVKVPAATLKGKITLGVLNSALLVKSTDVLSIVGSSVDPYVVYDNALSADWQKWGGWGTSLQDLANTEQASSGSNAIKVSFNDNYGALQLHPASTFAFPGVYTKLKISIYGGDNATASSRVAIYMKDATDPTDAQKVKLTLVPGTYTTFEIPLSDFSNNPAKINEFVIQNYGTPNLTIYIDDIIFL